MLILSGVIVVHYLILSIINYQCYLIGYLLVLVLTLFIIFIIVIGYYLIVYYIVIHIVNY